MQDGSVRHLHHHPSTYSTPDDIRTDVLLLMRIGSTSAVMDRMVLFIALSSSRTWS